jgi:beta-N-acetylhexosaminidase
MAQASASAGGGWRASIVRSGAIALGLALVGLGYFIPDPIAFGWRHALALGISACALVIGLAFLLIGHRWLATLFAAAAMLAVWQDIEPWIARQRVLARRGAEVIDVERHFVVGYDDIAVVRELISDGHVGGIFLTRRNVAHRTAEEVAAEIAGLQDLRRTVGSTPLIVTADQEGGPVAHLSPPLPYPPALSTLAALAPSERFAAARRIGFDQGRALLGLGVTMDLAPVVDLKPDNDAKVDWNTRIATRAIARDPAVVAAIAGGFSAGLRDAGITPTAKHFPGLGRVAVDTHLFSAALDAAEADLAAADWIPFRAVLNVPGSAVMLSHVALSAADAVIPASQSKRIVSGLLRERWGFDGIAITDDLTMGAVEHAGLCRAVEGALNAGIDLLLVSWDTDKAYPALRCALDALSAGRLSRQMLQQSAARLDRPTTTKPKLSGDVGEGGSVARP